MDKKNICIAISGDYGVGKSTFANKLKNTLGDKAVVLPLANGVRDKLHLSLGIPMTELHKKPTPPYIRDLLKGYGEYIKSLPGHQNYWCSMVQKKFSRNLINPGILIIDDLRFWHEVEFFKSKFDILDTIYIGSYSENYDLPQLYHNAKFFLDEFPDVGDYNINDRFL